MMKCTRLLLAFLIALGCAPALDLARGGVGSALAGLT
jgi:hypothetical protein